MNILKTRTKQDIELDDYDLNTAISDYVKSKGYVIDGSVDFDIREVTLKPEVKMIINDVERIEEKKQPPIDLYLGDTLKPYSITLKSPYSSDEFRIPFIIPQGTLSNLLDTIHNNFPDYDVMWSDGIKGDIKEYANKIVFPVKPKRNVKKED